MTEPTMRVLLADDDPLVRRFLTDLLNRQAGVQVVGAASDGVECLKLIDQLSGAKGIDVLLVDISMPRMTGIEVIDELRQRHPGLPVVVLTAFQQEEWLRDALAAGAVGFVTKDSPIRQIVAALQFAIRGERLFSAGAAELLVQAYAEVSVSPGVDDVEFRQRFQTLSDTQKAVARRVSDADSNDEIARGLGFSSNTIRRLVSEVLAVTQCKSRTQLATKMLRTGLME